MQLNSSGLMEVFEEDQCWDCKKRLNETCMVMFLFASGMATLSDPEGAIEVTDCPDYQKPHLKVVK